MNADTGGMTGAIPTILIVAGAGHVPEHYNLLRTHLTDAGYSSVCPLLPACGGPGHMDLFDNASIIDRELTKLVSQGTEVILVGHSSGAISASQALGLHFSRELRRGWGLEGGVVGMLFIAGLIPHLGVAFSSLGPLPPTWEQQPNWTFTVPTASELFFNGLPKEQSEHYASLLVPASMGVLFSRPTNEGWRHVPVTYLHTEDDKGLPLAVQQSLLEGIKAKGITFKTEKVNSGHSPFLSHPSEVVKVIEKITTETTGRQ